MTTPVTLKSKNTYLENGNCVSEIGFSLLHSPDSTRKTEMEDSKSNFNDLQHQGEVNLKCTENEMSCDVSKSSTSNSTKNRGALSKDELDEKGVIPLDTAELVASIDPFAELELIFEGFESINWYLQYQAIESARRLVIFHQDVIISKMPLVLSKIYIACDNLRSAMVKNALLAYSEVFRYMNSVIQDQLSSTIDILFRRAVCEKKFLRDAADEAIESMMEYTPVDIAIAAIIPWSQSKNSKISSKAAQSIAKICQKMEVDGKKPSEENLKKIILSLAVFRNGKEAVARNSAKVIGCYLKYIFADEFDVLVSTYLNPHDAIEMISDINNRPKSSGQSLRDTIRRDKAKKDKDIRESVLN